MFGELVGYFLTKDRNRSELTSNYPNWFEGILKRFAIVMFLKSIYNILEIWRARLLLVWGFRFSKLHLCKEYYSKEGRVL